MQENLDEPKVGKDVNRKYEKKFVDSVEALHGAAVTGRARTLLLQGDVVLPDGRGILPARFLYNP